MSGSTQKGAAPQDFEAELASAAVTADILSLSFLTPDGHLFAVHMPRLMGEGLWRAVGAGLAAMPPATLPTGRVR